MSGGGAGMRGERDSGRELGGFRVGRFGWKIWVGWLRCEGRDGFEHTRAN